MAIKKPKLTRPFAQSFAKRIDMRTPDCHVSCTCNSRLSQVEEYDEPTGKVLRKSVFKPVDRVAEMQNYSVNDFSLDNLLAIGAPLTPALLRRDNLSSIDAINSHLNSIVLPKNDN